MASIVWLFLGIGSVASALTAFWMHGNTIEEQFEIPDWCRAVEWFGPNRDDIANRFEAVKWFIVITLEHMLICFCFATAISILAVLWMSLLYALGGALKTWFAFFFFLAIPLIFIYVGSHFLFKLSRFRKLCSHVIFIVTYIVSIFYWSNFFV